uniref:dTDP-4-dehydrorhamnose reductase n=1 Tax=uncultured Geobacter sp. TaxID=186741 RepID=A0A060BWJ2_9BACT|nr:RmlD_sub_bind [uncultured Geobacter sp.]
MHILSKRHEVIGVCRDELDIADLDQVLSYFGQHSFDAVINSAAYTKVDQCETDFDNAFKANALGPRNLAVASDKYGFKLIHISTDYVFNGTTRRLL